MNRMKEYKRPLVAVVALECGMMLATSGLKYNQEEADENLEVLSNKRWQEPSARYSASH